MLKQKILLILTLLLILLGCFFTLYEIDGVSEKCNLITTIILLFNSTVILYIYFHYKKYVNLIIIPQIVSLVLFIVLWSDIADKFSLMSQRSIPYSYNIGFYMLLAGTFGNIILYILSIRVKTTKDNIKVTYTANKKTGSIKREEIH